MKRLKKAAASLSGLYKLIKPNLRKKRAVIIESAGLVLWVLGILFSEKEEE